MPNLLLMIIELFAVYLILATMVIFIENKNEKYDEEQDVNSKFHLLYIFDVLTEYTFIQSLLRSKILQAMTIIFVAAIILFVVLMMNSL